MYESTSFGLPVVYLAVLTYWLAFCSPITLLSLLDAHNVSQLGSSQLPVLMLRLETKTHF